MTKLDEILEHEKHIDKLVSIGGIFASIYYIFGIIGYLYNFYIFLQKQ